MKIFVFIVALIISASSFCQELTGTELLEKSIAYHDPNNAWSAFNGNFMVVMETPNSSERKSQIGINKPRQVFSLKVQQDSDSYSYLLDKDSCQILLNGQSEIDQEKIKNFRLNCERGTMFKNYYTYLYGLPMKLKDPGTILDSKIQTKTFKGKKYLVLKATYKAEVGDDIWYFYFDPETYAMEVYQFFHDESINDGEYILLKDQEEINGIKMPKTRAWYYNKDDKYLGTDVLYKAL